MFPTPQWLAASNLHSWLEMVEFYAEMVNESHWAHLQPLQRLVTAVADGEIARAFRAGQSVTTLMISTAARHGLELTDPFVAIKIRPPEFELQFDYHDGEQLMMSRKCAEADAETTLLEFLTHLGNDPNALAGRCRD